MSPTSEHENAAASAPPPIPPSSGNASGATTPRESRLATLLLALVTLALLIVSISNEVADPDLWQHLVVGRAIWDMHRVPTEHLWTWPNYGMPDVLPSWLYRVVLWPFWSLGGGVTGFYLLKWTLAVAAFALIWLVARRIGARGLSIFVLLAMCANIYRRRSERPEMLAVILLLLAMWVLESRRHGGKDRSFWLVPILWAWVNAHISYFFGFVIVGFHVLDDFWSRRRRARASIAPAVQPAAAIVPRSPAATRKLVLAGLAAFAASFVNPFGWRTLWQPFDFFLHNRNEPIFSTIGELMPVFWRHNWTNGLFVLVLGWPLLILWRARRRGLDLVELLTCAFFTPIMLSSQRFMAFYALAAIPYVARAITEWQAQEFPRPMPLVRRTALAIAAAVLIWVPEWLVLIRGTLGLKYDLRTFPVAATEWMAQHHVGGRGFNPFHWGGYMLWQSWPDRERLPFIDIHQTGTREDRLLYMIAHVDSVGWRNLDRQRRFDYVLFNRPLPEPGILLDVLDRDTTWALVFVDDASALYLRKEGRLADLARRHEYRKLVAGPQGIDALRLECHSDTAACAVIRSELERAVASSTMNSDAHSLLANLALLDGRYDQAIANLEKALAVNRYMPRAHYRLALIALRQDRFDDAVREFLLQRRMDVDAPGMSLQLGIAYQHAGDLKRARTAYRWALRRDPANPEARDSMLAISRRLDGR